MDFSTPALWWIAAGVLVAAELTTGTFYLLMLALGMAAGAVAALAGLAVAAQIVAAALIGGGATAAWHWRRLRQPHSAPSRENRDVNLDIGEQMNVSHWAGDRTAQVSYRGSVWTARLAPGSPAAAGLHRIQAVEGNWLVLVPAADH